MKFDLSPTYQKLVGNQWILWYAKSNKYSVVTKEFKTILESYFESDSLLDFHFKLGITNTASESDVSQNILSYLKRCNSIEKQEVLANIKFSNTKRNIVKQYSFDKTKIKIYYDSELALKIIHPAIAYLETKVDAKNNSIFDIFLENDNWLIYKEEHLITVAAKKDYHLIQGKFIMHLLCTIHNKKESDWIATFHGSTITDFTNSILFVGKSGQGKSTLCSLLAANGFKLVADDISPMLSKNNHIYSNPLAISIKEGAFDILRPIIKNFDNLPTTYLNKLKGPIKYVPNKNWQVNNYPCKAIVMVNYKKGSDITLENISIKKLLETVIPDSWLSPNQKHTKQFLDWLESIKIYKMTYSNTPDAIECTKQLFIQLSKNK
ncbi:hypothetical protein [Winogradskyella sp. PE311]|uniref:hypothetical protein n=1 Tax=Winogradskyella sp. PE311 TaxID=3366943 RepID=UPI00397F66F2